METKNSFYSTNNSLINSFNKIYSQKNKTVMEIVLNSNNIKYLKVICIRKNEYFGDVLMFLNERSPFYVKVRSKNTELIYLNKTDAIEISAVYPNIWNRITKKSLYNFKKIKYISKKLLIFYSKINGIILNDKTNNKIEKDDKSINLINMIDEISPTENKKNIKNKLLISDTKNQENNEYVFSDDNNYSIINNDNNNSMTKKIYQRNNRNKYNFN